MSWLCCVGFCNRPKIESKVTVRKSLKDVDPFTLSRARRRSVAVFTNKRVEKKDSLKGQNEYVKKKTLYPLKDQFRCMFCGGQKCPHENYLNNKKTAIIGLNCDLIDDYIYASQRPSNVLIKKHNLIQVFRDNQIGLIVNLQRPGEHPYCGPNILDKQSGFSYTPSLFVSEGIKVKLSGWKDMDVPDSLYFMLDIIKEMTFVVKVLNMKVLVHCHAGYGRTGIVVACYKMFNSRITAKEAVKRLREKRPKSIEKKAQMKYCFKFSECKNKKIILLIVIRQLSEVFTTDKTDINVFLKHQEDLNYIPFTTNHSIYVPRVILTCLESITSLKKEGQITNIEIFKALNGSTEINDEIYANISSITSNINNGDWEELENGTNLLILSETLFIWLDESVNACIYPFKIKELFNTNIQLDEQLRRMLKSIEPLELIIVTQITQVIKYVLRPYEFDILNCFARFLGNLYPHNDTEGVFNEYRYMIEKIAIFLVGYTIDLLYDKEEKTDNNIDIKKCFVTVEQTILLIDFLTRVHIQELSEPNELKTMNSIGKTSTRKYDNYEKKKNQEYDLSHSIEQKDNSMNYSELGSATPFKISNEKEKQLYVIYQSLKKHFEGTDKNKDDESDSQNMKNCLLHNYHLDKSSFDNKISEENNYDVDEDNNDGDDNEKQEEDSSSMNNDTAQDNEKKRDNNNFFLGKRRSTSKLKYRFPVYRPVEKKTNQIPCSPFLIKIEKNPLTKITDYVKDESIIPNKSPIEYNLNKRSTVLCLRDVKYQ